jgi:hypothetical protein
MNVMQLLAPVLSACVQSVVYSRVCARRSEHPSSGYATRIMFDVWIAFHSSVPTPSPMDWQMALPAEPRMTAARLTAALLRHMMLKVSSR